MTRWHSWLGRGGRDRLQSVMIFLKSMRVLGPSSSLSHTSIMVERMSIHSVWMKQGLNTTSIASITCKFVCPLTHAWINFHALTSSTNGGTWEEAVSMPVEEKENHIYDNFAACHAACISCHPVGDTTIHSRISSHRSPQYTMPTVASSSSIFCLTRNKETSSLAYFSSHRYMESTSMEGVILILIDKGIMKLGQWLEGKGKK